MKELRTDQQSAIDQLDGLITQGKRRIVIQAPCGYGKTILAAHLINRERNRGKRVLFVVPVLALIDQTVDVLKRGGVDDIGVIQAQNDLTNGEMPIQIASVATLQRRNLQQFQYVIIDEVHKWWSFYEKWLLDPAWADIPIIGLSATPWTKGLGAYFSDLLIAGTTQGMIDSGNLSDFRVYAPSSPDLTGVRTLAGDYHEGDLAIAMNKATLVADIVTTWQRLGEGRPTLCFAVDRAHAKNIQQQFIASGISAGYQDAFTKDDDRRAIRAKFHSGEYKVVCNVGTLTTGVDWDVRCVIMARPTKSEMLFVQIIGRGLRTADGKDHCLILDHSDNHIRLGFVTDILHEQLSDGTKAISASVEGIRLPKKCPQCSYMKPPKTPVCPACGFKAEARPQIEIKRGDLKELKRMSKLAEEAEWVEEVWGNRRLVYGQLLTMARLGGKKDGWAYYKYLDIYGDKPHRSWQSDPPISPTPDVMNWITSRNIARARGYHGHR